MDDIDSFASLLWEQAKRFLEKARDASGLQAGPAYLNSSLMLGFAALEAHVNAVAEEHQNFANVSVHDRGILREREVRLENGVFRLSPATKFIRLEDRILFLHSKFGGRGIDRKVSWWSDLQSASKIRNDITHPKTPTSISQLEVERALLAIIEALNALYLNVYRKPFPSYNRRLNSNLDF